MEKAYRRRGIPTPRERYGNRMEGIKTAQFCARYADDKKAEDIVILDVRGLSPVSDFFVICTANSTPQLRAIRDEIDVKMKEDHNIPPWVTDGHFESQWLILDYGDVMVHIFMPEKREFYNLEKLWGDAPRVDWAA